MSGVQVKEFPVPENKVPTGLRSVDGPCLNSMVTGYTRPMVQYMFPKTPIGVQLTEPSPPDQVTLVGEPAWTAVGTLVNASFCWARADTTKVRPRTRLFEKSIFSVFVELKRRELEE